jgi:signal transduction histidine kinase
VDVESVRQVILNLLINACAATPAGGAVHLRTRATERALAIEIGDQGPGLPEDLAKYLVGGSNESPGEGIGLGLWIVRRLVADQDGHISVGGQNGLSTVIRITWPFREELTPVSRPSDVRAEAIHAE